MKHLNIASFLRLLRVEIDSGQPIEIEHKDAQTYHYSVNITIGVCPMIRFKPSKNEVYVATETTKFWTSSSFKGDDAKKLGMNKRNISWWHARQLVSMTKELITKHAMGARSNIEAQFNQEMWDKCNKAMDREMAKFKLPDPLETKDKLLEVANAINNASSLNEERKDGEKRPLRSMGGVKA